LTVDHRSMPQLLRILEEEIDAYNAGKPSDFDLMKQILEYTLHYPNLASAANGGMTVGTRKPRVRRSDRCTRQSAKFSRRKPAG
jgi:hypothetical protein